MEGLAFGPAGKRPAGAACASALGRLQVQRPSIERHQPIGQRKLRLAGQRRPGLRAVAPVDAGCRLSRCVVATRFNAAAVRTVDGRL
jgi:hypothetical protein